MSGLGTSRATITGMTLLQRLGRVEDLRVLPPELRPVVPGARLLGRAVTADARDDLMSVLAALELAGAGDVLVIGGGAGRALAGELFATEAVRRGVTGLVIDGPCRDTPTLARLPIPVYARGATPRAAPAQAVPVVQLPVLIGGVEVRPGDLLIGDDDGIVVGTESELEAALDAAEAILGREQPLLSSMEGGASLFDHLNFREHADALAAGRPSSLRSRRS
jgi:4-hydroxy-4-methyl-2-oxoglutarate aldolase